MRHIRECIVVLIAQQAAAVEDCTSLCRLLLERTDNEALSRVMAGVLQPVFEILVVLALALIARRVVRRVVRSTVERATTERPAVTNRFGHRPVPVSAAALDRRHRRAESMGALGNSVSGAVIWTIALFTVLGSVGIDLAPLIAGAGIVGVAIGFGAQDLVKDFLSGVFMLVEDQYGVGDFIDVGEARGIVEGITLRSTRIRDPEGKLWHVPNGEIRRVANESQEWARAVLDVGVAYGADVNHAIETLNTTGHSMWTDETWRKELLEEPEVWGVQNLGADSVDIRVALKTKPGKQFEVARELRRRIKLDLDEAGIEIPFSQRTVWLRTDATGEDTPVVGVRDA